jgi:hypothetical protein
LTKQRAKPTEDQPEVVVNYTILHWFAVETDEKKLSGVRGIGRTPLDALSNMRGQVLRHYPLGQYRLVETITNPEFAKGWRMPESDGR